MQTAKLQTENGGQNQTIVAFLHRLFSPEQTLGEEMLIAVIQNKRL